MTGVTAPGDSTDSYAADVQASALPGLKKEDRDGAE